MAKKTKKHVEKIRTGSFERKFLMAKAGLVAGTRYASKSAGAMLKRQDQRRKAHKRALSQEAHYLVEELGKLKGSVVKIGQMMALYGELFLPEEITDALHTLEEDTTPVAWTTIHHALITELGSERLMELEIDPVPLGAASLGQVHKAVRKSDGKVVCLKVQYPGVAEAIDSDLSSVASLLKLTRSIQMGKDFDQWFNEIRFMMHREVDYYEEAHTTKKFRQLLANDPRYVVPEVIDRYSTGSVLCTSFEEGLTVNSDSVLGLTLERRNHIAKSALDLLFKELFVWKEMQTDPNFGNYRIRLSEDGKSDQLVLLDFGAVRSFDDSVMKPVQLMIKGGYLRDKKRVLEGAIAVNFMQDYFPPKVLNAFTEIVYDLVEPFANGQHPPPAFALNQYGEYCWSLSDLPARVARKATISAVSKHFNMPPKEFLFLQRKLVGVYTMISVLNAEFNGQDVFDPYFELLADHVSQEEFQEA
ncbi:ABC1 kinase family protein [Litoribrevibacter albus]|uniref:ABC transporter n=1 Tax=Litoribrevibacter albus TaxID=1473156 RepID=A0AA37SCA2_9GAMM|nr:AarF/ABC1/UbiB kinase family protein [Litoribrevibacter albus]GLQ32150.1 ABC transporter [Litoribrevibacter albus]